MKKLKIPDYRLNIGIIIPFLEKYGGAERYLIECVRYWQDKHYITVYASKINDKLLAEHGIGKQVKRHEFSPYFEDEVHSMLLNAVLLPKVWQMEIGKHDLYHTHLWPTHLVDLHPMVWYPHEPLRVLHDLRYEQNVEHIGNEASRNIHIYPKYNYDRIADFLFEATLSSIDSMDKAALPERIVANSKYTAGYLSDVYGVEVTDVVYPGVEPEGFLNLPKERNLFVTISQLWPHKRVNLLIEAIALTDDAQLIVIGSGPEKERLMELAENLGIDDRVFFLSGLSNKELELVLARACAFLFAPIKEPFGIVVLEAMAAGLPVIAVNEGGYVEACDPSYSFLIKPFPTEFAEKIQYLQRNPDIARKMGKLGMEVAPKFTWKRAADELEAILVDTWKKFAVTEDNSLNSSSQTLFGLQYYLWFGDGFGAAHWNDNQESGHVSDKPLPGYYCSFKGQTIEYHFDLFEKMGVDYLILNLHLDHNGLNGLELSSIQHVFDIAKRRQSPLRFAIQLAPYADETEELEKAIRMIRKIYSAHPNYFHLDGKPVLFWFWSTAFDGNFGLISKMKEACGKFTNIAASLRLPHEATENRMTYGFFDGFVPFSPLELSSKDNWLKVWNSAYAAAEKAGMRYRIASISPGYDDTGLKAANRVGNPYRLISREGGKTYMAGMDFVRGLKKRPHLVMISTFNEFHENTHIEPSSQNGREYVDMTENFIKSMKDN